MTIYLVIADSKFGSDFTIHKSFAEESDAKSYISNFLINNKFYTDIIEIYEVEHE